MNDRLNFVELDAIVGQARAILRLSGPDTERFLQGTLSADLRDLGTGEARASALLTVKAKIVSEAIVVRLADEVGLIVPADLADDLAAMLERHIIMDDVTCVKDTGTAIALAWPADAAATVISGTELSGFRTRHPAPGMLVLGDPDHVRQALTTATKVDGEAFAAHRIETASPGWGHELAPDFFPPEVGFVYAVSYEKGCFLGQEPLARIHARGQVNRVMVRVAADAAPDEPLVLSSEKRDDAGRWTSWAPADSGVIGLAIVRRDVATPDTVLRSPLGPVTVTSGPLGDDPGLG